MVGEKRGGKVYIRIPQKGMKEKLVELAQKNAELVLSQDKEKIKREEGRTIGAMKEIAGWLDLPGLQRVEAFDISNINGFETVGSMVVYEKGKPKRSDYRKFRLRTVPDRMITPPCTKCLQGVSHTACGSRKKCRRKNSEKSTAVSPGFRILL